MEYFILILAIVLLFLVAAFAFFIVVMLIWTGVPFIPTKDKIIVEMLELVKLRDNLKIYELGCGNGKMLFSTKKKCDNLKLKNVRITGYELIIPLVWWGRFKYKFLPKTSNQIEIFSRDFFHQYLGESDIIFCYLFPPIMQRIFREIWPKLKSGTILISHAFSIEGLQPQKVIETSGTKIYVYEK